MGTVQGIRKLGFERWYGRQLVRSFSYLVTCFLGIILVACTIAVLGESHTILDVILNVSLAGIGALVILGALQLHLRSMLLAETLAAAASCPSCHKYAAFQVVASGPRLAEIEGESEDHPPWLRVRCHRCRCEWVMDSDQNAPARRPRFPEGK